MALALHTGFATAATIELTYFLDTSLGSPQSGWEWAIERFPITPFAPLAGDTLILHIEFDRPLIVEDLGPDANDEMILITLDTAASTSGGADALSYGTFEFLNAQGQLLTPNVSWSTDSGGFGIGAQRFVNLTDSSFSFSRMDITWTLSTFYFTPPSDQFHYLWVTFDADRITVASTPAPGSLLQQLLDDVTGVGPGKSLANKVKLAQTYYAVPDRQATCAVLTGFVNEVRAQRGKKIAPNLADKLTADARVIMSRIGCS
jgi:hypothetical protein